MEILFFMAGCFVLGMAIGYGIGGKTTLKHMSALCAHGNEPGECGECASEWMRPRIVTVERNSRRQ